MKNDGSEDRDSRESPSETTEGVLEIRALLELAPSHIKVELLLDVAQQMMTRCMMYSEKTWMDGLGFIQEATVAVKEVAINSEKQILNIQQRAELLEVANKVRIMMQAMARRHWIAQKALGETNPVMDKFLGL